jgi:putative membrane protein
MAAPTDASVETLRRGAPLAADHPPVTVTTTELALTRNLLAAERTLMAWIRTGLSMISFGFTLGRLADALTFPEVNLLFGHDWDVLAVASYLVTLGTLALILAAIQYKVDVAALTPLGLKRRPSLAFAIAVLLSLLGMFAFTDLVTRL